MKKTWEVWWEEHHCGWEDATTVEAFDAEDAATTYVEQAEAADCEYPVAECHERAIVHVRERGKADETVWIVEGDPEPRYYARTKT